MRFVRRHGAWQRGVRGHVIARDVALLLVQQVIVVLTVKLKNKGKKNKEKEKKIKKTINYQWTTRTSWQRIA